MSKDIDELMKEWDVKERPVFADKEELKKRVLERLREKPTLVEDRHVRVHKGWLTSGVIAALALLTFNIVYFSSNTENAATAEQVAALSMDDLYELKKVSEEVNNLFPEGVRWISKDGDKLEIKTGASDLDSSQIAIRYVVLEKMDSGWEQIHMTDIITRTGEAVELVGKTKGHVWVHDAGQGVFALDSELEFHLNGGIAKINFSSGLEKSKSQEVKFIKLNGREYKIYQAILEV